MLHLKLLLSGSKILKITTALVIAATASFTTVAPTIASDTTVSNELVQVAQAKTAAEKREERRLEREKRRKERAEKRKNRRGGFFGGSFS